MNKVYYHDIYNCFWSLAQFVSRGHELSILKSLEQSQYFSVDRLQEIQLTRVLKLINYAYKNVPFYAKRFKEIRMHPDDLKSMEDLNNIPLLTRKDIQDNLSSLQSKEIRPGKFLNYTGGSTGNPVAFYQDKYFLENYKASIIRFRRWYGFNRGDKVAYIWGAERDVPQWSKTVRFQVFLKRQKWLNAFRMNDGQIQYFLRDLQDWRPSFIIGYASALHSVALYILRHGVTGIQPIAIESSAERLWGPQKRDIEKAFNAPVINLYGSREMSPIAAQCMEQNGLHVMAETRLVQITDSSGLPKENGQTGNVVLTDLTNYTMPLIRYANGDMASSNNKHCSCGRTLPMLDKIEGRTSDLIITKYGMTIHGEFFTHLFYGKPILQFQVRQTALDKLVILICPADSFSGRLLSEVKQRIDEFSENAFEIAFRIVDEIPPTASGKYRFTISELDQVT